MALRPCKECKNEVAATAPTCPHCGVKNPGVRASDTAYGLVGLLAIVGVVAYACTDSDAEKEAKRQAAAATQAANDAACLKDLQCIGDKAVMSAGIKCPREIEKFAKGQVKWTDGTLEPKFSRFRWKDEKAHIVTLFGDKVQFQNGFGGFINMVYSCDMDMSQGSGRDVLRVTVEEGRL